MADSPIVVDGDLGDEKISELLERRTEYSALDYKRRIDLSEKRDEVELSKDVGAMSVLGGYILIGVEDDGSLTGSMDNIDTRAFDEASLRSKLLRYLPEPIQIVTRKTEREQHVVVAICVMPRALASAQRAGSGPGDPEGDAKAAEGSEGQAVIAGDQPYTSNGGLAFSAFFGHAQSRARSRSQKGSRA